MGVIHDEAFYVADTRTPEGQEAAGQFGVRIFPTFMVLNSEGELVARWIGYRDPGSWLRIVNRLRDDPVTVPVRIARYEREPSVQDAILLGRIKYGEGEHREAEGWYRRALALDRQTAVREEVPMRIFWAAFRGSGSGKFTVEEADAIVSEMLHSGEMTTDNILTVTSRLVGVIDKAGEGIVAAHLRTALHQLEDVSDPDLQDRLWEFQVSFATIVEKDLEKAFRLKKVSLPDGWSSDPMELNNIAWWCFENNIHLEKAEIWAKKSVASAEEISLKANVMDTLAEIVNTRGNSSEALRLIEEALKLAPENEYLQGQKEKFQELAGENRAGL